MSSNLYGGLALLSLSGTVFTFFGGATEIVGIIITIGANGLAISLAMKNKYNSSNVPIEEETTD